MAQYETLTKAVMVLPKGEPIFSEMATTVELDDEAAGLFVVVSQDGHDGEGKISICAEEWPLLREQINTMVQVCLERNKEA